MYMWRWEMIQLKTLCVLRLITCGACFSMQRCRCRWISITVCVFVCGWKILMHKFMPKLFFSVHIIDHHFPLNMNLIFYLFVDNQKKKKVKNVTMLLMLVLGRNPNIYGINVFLVLDIWFKVPTFWDVSHFAKIIFMMCCWHFCERLYDALMFILYEFKFMLHQNTTHDM